MITRAYIHEYGMGRLEPEHQDVYECLLERNIPVALFTNKKIDRRQLKLDHTTLVVGNHPVIRKALKYLHINDLAPSCYPESINNFLNRAITTSSLGAVQAAFHHGNLAAPFFIKPQGIDKKFTGFVLRGFDDFRLFEGASRQTPVYLSEVVAWQSEYRVFVIQGEIVGVRHYDGNPAIQLDLSIVDACIQRLEASKEATAAYGIDFGVLASGETACVEWNDGYALGSYGLDKEIYTDLLIARWEELMG